MADTTNKKLVSKKFRIAVEGDTTDGREIEASWLQEMAATYNPDVYAARIWNEHIRGYSADNQGFGAYGDVVSVTAESIELEGQKRMALFAVLAPTPELVAINQKRQKLYTSMEIDPDFAKTGKAYLVGLGITDSPASLGTEMLQFSAKAPVNPLAGRKQRAENLFSACHEADLQFEEVKEKTSILDSVTSFFKKHEKQTGKQFNDSNEAILFLGKQLQELSDKFEQFSAGDGKETAAQIEQLSNDLKDLRSSLDSTEKHHRRPTSTGGNDAVLTDC